jgi:hypothetical protein
MRDATIEAIDELVGPATPHFAYQLRARVAELIQGLPADHPARRYGEEKMALLDRLGWDTIPSTAPADSPLPRRR